MTPLLAWVSFILSIYLMRITTMIIMRRHWVEHDRLTFPLLQLPMDMAEEGEPGSKLTPFVKQLSCGPATTGYGGRLTISAFPSVPR